jgi:ParB family chromosome partitioning protein
MGQLILDYDLRTLQGAEYNPRRIAEADLADLRESVQTLGIIKPIIARDTVIVAGHQRTRSALAVDIETGPVFQLGSDANIYDEVRFNQLHNGTDLDAGAAPVRVTRDLSGVNGWTTVTHKDIEGDFRCPGAVVRAEIQRLVAKFGPWGACVVAPDGTVLHCSHYALAVAAMRLPITCYVLAESQVEAAVRFLGKTYGVFDYSHLPRNTFIQTFAQPVRLRGEKECRSHAYTKWALPWLVENPGARMLDFGCGQGDQVADARSAGHDVTGLELFPRPHDRIVLDIGAAKRMANALARQLTDHGRFDAVLCDFVLNSVDCAEAETSVLACLDLFVKPGGQLFFSGRGLVQISGDLAWTKMTTRERRVEFLDDNRFSALYRNGQWFYQRFHSEDEIEAIAERHGWEIVKLVRGRTWHVKAVKREQKLTPTDYAAAVQYEFTLPVNTQGRTLGVVDTMLAAAARVW